MLVNRLGKALIDNGIDFTNFLKENDIKMPYDTFYSWCVSPVTPRKGNYIYVEQIANALGETFVEVMNMIASKGDIEVHPLTTIKDENNLLKLARASVNLTARELAEKLGLQTHDIYNLEFGIGGIPKMDVLSKYLDIIGMSHNEFLCEYSRIREAYLAHQSEFNDKYREAYNAQKEKAEEEDLEGKSYIYAKVNDTYELVPVNENPNWETVEAVDPRVEEALRFLYGKVDFEIYNEVSRILKGE